MYMERWKAVAYTKRLWMREVRLTKAAAARTGCNLQRVKQLKLEERRLVVLCSFRIAAVAKAATLAAVAERTEKQPVAVGCTSEQSAAAAAGSCHIAEAAKKVVRHRIAEAATWSTEHHMAAAEMGQQRRIAAVVAKSQPERRIAEAEVEVEVEAETPRHIVVEAAMCSMQGHRTVAVREAGKMMERQQRAHTQFRSRESLWLARFRNHR